MGFKVMVFCVLTVVVVGSSAQLKYCTLCPDHTLCIYQGKGAKCGAYKSGGVSDKEIATILDLTNGYRSRVAQGQETQGAGPLNVGGPQPSASNMMKLMWCPELARIAQRWADQCINTNDACHEVSKFTNVGQTLAQVASNNATGDWNKTVALWYSSVQDFQKLTVDAYKYKVFPGAYAKIVWANTFVIGCGYSFFKPADSSTNMQYFVCNYGPAGNQTDQPVYLRGAPCSKCPSGTQCAGNGLCA